MSESLLFSDVLMDVQAAFSDADFKSRQLCLCCVAIRLSATVLNFLRTLNSSDLN